MNGYIGIYSLNPKGVLGVLLKKDLNHHFTPAQIRGGGEFGIAEPAPNETTLYGTVRSPNPNLVRSESPNYRKRIFCALSYFKFANQLLSSAPVQRLHRVGDPRMLSARLPSGTGSRFGTGVEAGQRAGQSAGNELT